MNKYHRYKYISARRLTGQVDGIKKSLVVYKLQFVGILNLFNGLQRERIAMYGIGKNGERDFNTYTDFQSDHNELHFNLMTNSYDTLKIHEELHNN